MPGWMGKILRIDLSQGSHEVESLDLALAKNFIGGRGLAAKILCDEVDPTVDALSPENKLIFATGPLTGTGAISGCMFDVVTKSPLTGCIACSASGGHFGPEIKYAGYDAIILEGKSAQPVYLSIQGNSVGIVPAGPLWGLPTDETEAIIKVKMKDRWQARETHITSIGPAGEKLVRFASIVSDKHWLAARSGVGAVMGSKNLKAIAISGQEDIALAGGENFMQIVSGVLEQVKASLLTSKVLPEIGTAFLVDTVSQQGALPARNFQGGVFAGAERINGKALMENMLVGKAACFACPIACRRMTKVSDSALSGKGQGPDYEALAALGVCCGIDDLAAITKASYLCAELGLDPISTGVTIACAMELCEKGVLSENDVGMKLNFGNNKAMLELIRRLAVREKFGDVLAEGAYHLAERYGQRQSFMGVKGQEMPPYDPRAIQGMGLQYATANSGACHESGYVVVDEVLGVHRKMNPLETEGKAELVKLYQDVTAVLDSCGICYLVLLGKVWTKELFAMLAMAAGAAFNERNLLLAGERIYNLERLFNQRAGLKAKDDNLPQRMLEEPMPEGAAQGQICRLNEMLPEYYRLRGWDETGFPTEAKLNELGLYAQIKLGEKS